MKKASKKPKTLPESQKDVHTEHCCVIHGCKYGDEDCPVATKKKPQSFVCESCDVYDGIHTLDMLHKVINQEINRCPHCGHVLP